MTSTYYDMSHPFFDTLKEVLSDVGIALPPIVTSIVTAGIVQRFGPVGAAAVELIHALYYKFEHGRDQHGDGTPEKDNVKFALSLMTQQKRMTPMYSVVESNQD